MAFYDKFPYTNFQELNLDWIINALKILEQEQKEFINNNVIKYANPIGWNITTQYEANTVVTDVNGNAYISSQPVPSGVNITNTEYWSKIGNFDALWTSVKEGITTADEGAGTTASAPRTAGDLVWVQDKLLKVTAPMIAGDSYVIGSNCILTDMDDELKALRSYIQTLSESIQAAIQEEANAREQADENLGNTLTAAYTEADAAITEAYTAADTAITDAYTAADDALNDRITDLEETVSTTIRNVITISDSYGLRGDTPWTTLFPTYVGDIDNYYTYSEGSAGFNRQGDRNHTFLTLLQAHMTDFDPETITDIIVGGGANDALAVNGLLNAVVAFCEYVHENFPKAKIHIAYIGHTFGQNDAALDAEQEAFFLYSSGASKSGAAFWRNVKWIMHDPHNVMEDAVHPNVYGSEQIARAMASYYNGGDYQYLKTYTVNMTFNSGITVDVRAGLPMLQYTINNDKITFKWNHFILHGITIPAQPSESTTYLNSEIELGTSDDIYATRAGWSGILPLSWSGSNVEGQATAAQFGFALHYVYLYIRSRTGSTNSHVQDLGRGAITMDILNIF